jgi:hypothetical protein
MVGSWSIAAAVAKPVAVLDPEKFGARGDGKSDDTRALQACVDSAPKGAVVRLRRGGVYRINTNAHPSWESFGGLRLKSEIILDLNGAELRALPSVKHQGAVVQAFWVDNWRILGPGKITGDRDIHVGTAGEWGMGIAVFSSHGWTISSGVEINNCWGDGILVDAREGPRAYSEDFLIDRVHIWNCRRNGITITAGRNGEIRGVDIHDIAGTAPQGAIDLEPDHRDKPNRNIRIRDGKLRRAQVGIYVSQANEDVLITGMDIEVENSGIIVSDNSARVRILDNPRIANTKGGIEGAAIRTAATNTNNVRSLHIQRNRLYGGGYFVIDIFGVGYPDLLITHNQLYASNNGVQGIARIGAARFTDNVGVIEQNAGKAGEFYVLFDNVIYGRNTYRNNSRHNMWKLVRLGGSDLGGETYIGPS